MPRFLLVLDVDSTLIENEVIELLAAAAGSEALVREVTFRAMNGELDFAESLRERVATLAGLPESVFAAVGQQVRVTRGAAELIEGVHAAGGWVTVVSGGFHEVVDPIAEELGLDRWLANRLGVHEGRLDGSVVGEVVDAQAKADALRRWAAELGVPLAQTVAIGDGANDLPMMAAAGLSIGFDAKAPVRDEANLVLDERDLSAVLAVLGLR